MLAWLAQLPLFWFVVAALTLGLAPFTPEPHLVEKVRMLAGGTLAEPVDVFDLVLHATPWVLLALRLVAGAVGGGAAADA